MLSITSAQNHYYKLDVQLIHKLLVLPWNANFKWRCKQKQPSALVESVLFFWHIGWYETTSGCFCWNLILLWHTKLPNDIYYNYWYVWHSNFSQYLLPELLLFYNYLFITGKWNLQHITVIIVLSQLCDIWLKMMK